MKIQTLTQRIKYLMKHEKFDPRSSFPEGTPLSSKAQDNSKRKNKSLPTLVNLYISPINYDIQMK